jgi:hypothetical protein
MGKTIAIVVLSVVFLFCAFLVYFTKSAYLVLPGVPPKTFKLPPKFEDWVEFTPSDGKFNVKLPVLPQKATDTVTDPETKQMRHYEMYVSQTNEGTLYLVSLITFQDLLAIEKQEQLLTETMNGMVEANSQNVLKTSKIEESKNLKTLIFTVENPTNIIDAKAFISGKILILLAMIAPKDHFDPKAGDFFFNSFKIVSEQPFYTPFPPQT